MTGVPKLVYLVTEDWFFCSHFLPMARAARDLGLDVVVATRCREHRQPIEREGIRVVALPWQRAGEGTLAVTRRFFDVLGLLRRERPDILHCIALKPVILGGLAAKLAGNPATICAVTGLGRTWIGGGLRRRGLRALIRRMLWLIARDRRVRILVENTDHERAFAAWGVAPREQILRVPGAGVDTERYSPVERGPGECAEYDPAECGEDAPAVVAALVARMIPIKGVEVAVEAVRKLAERGVGVRLLLVGAPDPGHRGSIHEGTLEAWSRHPSIRWLGRREDIAAVWAEADIAVLPSLGGDGLPKSLLEAAACGKPIVTTDTDGCREVVRDGINGLLVPPGDVEALARAIERLVGDPQLRRVMGGASRGLVEESFTESIVAGTMAELYRSLLREGYDCSHGFTPESRP